MKDFELPRELTIFGQLESSKRRRSLTEDIRTSSKGNTAYLNIGAWYDQETGHIHLTLPNSGWFHTTVNANETSKRGHPNLYGKLARALREAGAPATAAETADPT